MRNNMKATNLNYFSDIGYVMLFIAMVCKAYAPNEDFRWIILVAIGAGFMITYLLDKKTGIISAKLSSLTSFEES